MFKIATWNVNSLKVRLPNVLEWLAAYSPDVLALQEIKMTEDLYPLEAILQAGYQSVCNGQKTYNGVALFSRHAITDIIKENPIFEDPQRRVLGATIAGLRILNVYVPNGESVTSTKYQYKLEWLKYFTQFLQIELQKHARLIVLGDFNIAPHDIDVHDPVQWEGRVLCSGPEREAFQAILQTGLTDCFRKIHPEDPGFTWWDYRLNAFKRRMGLRIDHILASDRLAMTCQTCEVDVTPRSAERPSDHAPLVAGFSHV